MTSPLPTGRLAYFDCFSGASGDMLLGSLLDAGLSLDALRGELARLPFGGYALSATAASQHDLAGTKFDVALDEHEHTHRHLSDIEELIRASGLPAPDQERSIAIFRRLGRAEAKVHGVPIDDVHFHEVGAVDSIVDIVGFAVGLRLMEITRVYASALPLGSGFIRSAHGTLPVPAPATLEVLAEAQVPTRALDAGTELVTPTGAAILAELAEFRQPDMAPAVVGYGFGSRQLPWANAVRVWIGESPDAAGQRDRVVLLECNIDDMSAEALGFAMERSLAAGALDVWFAPIQMKKNRPGVMLSVLCRPADVARLRREMLLHTSTLGVREQEWQREVAGRRTVSLKTPWGEVRAKLKLLDGQVASVHPEFEDCAALARAAGVPLLQVYQAAVSAYGPPGSPAEVG
jgi:pyridinium-3,5-bisthiocarboxylic acid mononucleotide nickel chelatase